MVFHALLFYLAVLSARIFVNCNQQFGANITFQYIGEFCFCPYGIFIYCEYCPYYVSMDNLCIHFS